MTEILQKVDQVIGRIHSLGDTNEDELMTEFLLKWLAMRLIRQYHVDVWAGLYAWSYEFMGKNKE